MVQLRKRQPRPGRPAVVTLVGALGHFHLPQQRIHLGNGQTAMRVNGRATRQRAQKLIGGTIEVMRIRLEIQVPDHRFDYFGHVFPGNQRRHATKGEPCWSEGVQVETCLAPLGTALEDGVHLVSLELHDNGLKQMLRCGARHFVLRFQPFVQDTLMRGVHIYEDETVAILREDVDPVELR